MRQAAITLLPDYRSQNKHQAAALPMHFRVKRAWRATPWLQAQEASQVGPSLGRPAAEHTCPILDNPDKNLETPKVGELAGGRHRRDCMAAKECILNDWISEPAKVRASPFGYFWATLVQSLPPETAPANTT